METTPSTSTSASVPDHLKKIIDAPEIENIRTDLNSLGKNGKALVNNLKTEGGEAVRDGWKQLKSTGASEYHKVEAYVKEKPGHGIALGFVSGLVVSMLLGGRRHH